MRSFSVTVALASILLTVSSHPHVGLEERNPSRDADNLAALERLKARHPVVKARVLGRDPGLGDETLFQRRAPQAASSVVSAATTPILTATSVPGVNLAAVEAIRSTTTPEVTSALPTTYAAGSSSPISGAPALPAVNIVPADYPALDLPPPLNTTQVQTFLSQVNLTGVPNIAVNGIGGCANTTTNAAAVTNAAANGWWTCGGYTRATDITECPTKNTWGMTLDDGPSPDTPRILEYLDQHSIKSTFFVVGSRVISRPQMLQYEYMDGHQICVHTWSHTALTTQTNEEIVAELGWSKYAIKQVLGVTPNCMRPPYGDIDDRVRFISAAMGLTPVIWTSADGHDFDTQDWQIGAGVSPITVVNNVATILNSANSLSTGFILLQHDLFQQSVDVALDFSFPYSMDITPALTYQPVITCIGKAMSESYIETATNSTGPVTSVVGSTGTGVVSVPAASGGASSSSSSKSKSTASHSIGIDFNLLVLGLGLTLSCGIWSR